VKITNSIGHVAPTIAHEIGHHVTVVAANEQASAAARKVPSQKSGSRIAGVLVRLVRPLLKVSLLGYRAEMANALFPDGPAAGEVPGTDPIRMLFIGDCAASGYGVLNHGLAVVSKTARYVANDHNRGCTWSTITDPELTAIRSATALSTATMNVKFDVVVVLLGPPDVLVGTATSEWAGSLSRVIELVRKNPDANCPVVLAAIPPMYRFRPMPEFVRRILMLQTHRLNRTSRSLAHTLPRVTYSHFPPIGSDGTYIMELLSWRTIHSLWGKQLGKDVSHVVGSGVQ
jgi:hypothetical protein